MRILFIFFLLCALPAFAADKVPDLVFSQQVNIVVTAKKDPRVFEVKIGQAEEKVKLDLIVDQNVDRRQAKGIAQQIVMLTKSMSLDDHPKDDKQPGKGLYTYLVTIAHPDGVILLNAKKPKNKEKLSFENPAPDLEPLTRADAKHQ